MEALPCSPPITQQLSESPRRINVSGSETGSALNMIAWIKVKIAVLHQFQPQGSTPPQPGNLWF